MSDIIEKFIEKGYTVKGIFPEKNLKDQYLSIDRPDTVCVDTIISLIQELGYNVVQVQDCPAFGILNVIFNRENLTDEYDMITIS